MSKDNKAYPWRSLNYGLCWAHVITSLGFAGSDEKLLCRLEPIKPLSRQKESKHKRQILLATTRHELKRSKHDND